jgi:hypothetical protein
MERETNHTEETNNKVAETITRKEALIKTGKYAAFTALGMMVLLSPKQSQAQSPANPGGRPAGW